MFQLHDEPNDWKWSSFGSGVCRRYEDTAFGRWQVGPDMSDGFFPNVDQIDTVACREYTKCPEFGDDKDEIKTNKISTTCEPYPDSNETNGCKRYRY